MLQDLRFTVRGLFRTPGFVSVTALTMAVGIAAVITMFSLIDAVLLHSVPVPDAGRLFVLRWDAAKPPKISDDVMSVDSTIDPGNAHGYSFAFSASKQFQSLTKAFDHLAAMSGPTGLVLSGAGDARLVTARFVSGEFFNTITVGASVGRPLEIADDNPTAEPAVMLDYRYWRTAFAADRSIIGTTILLNGVGASVVGVAPQGFPGLEPGTITDVWLPLAAHSLLIRDRLALAGASDDIWWLAIVARVRADVKQEQAQAATTTIFRSSVLFGTKPFLTEADSPAITLQPSTIALDGMRSKYSGALITLMIAVSTVLLVSCVNLAQLLLARTTARGVNIAVRLALGASFGRVISQIYLESLLICGCGGAIAIPVAWWITPIVTGHLLMGGPWSSEFDVHLSARAVAFGVILSILCGILSGTLPVLRTKRMDIASALQTGMGTLNTALAGAGRRLSPRNLLVITQVALSALVLIGAGLVIRTLANLKSVDPGFDTARVLLFGLDPSLSGYKGKQSQNLYDRLQARLNSLPGVVSVGYSREPLLSGNTIGTEIHLQDNGHLRDGDTSALPIGPNFVETMRIPVVAGRSFVQADFGSDVRPHPALVNQSFVRRYFQDHDPIGSHFWTGNRKEDFEIVGILGDSKYKNLREKIDPTIYMPLTAGSAWFAIRTEADPNALIAAVRGCLGEIDQTLPLIDIRSESEQITHSLFMERAVATMSTFFGVFVVIVTFLGLYSLLSYEVTVRTREFGIRMALGAARPDLVLMIVGRSALLTAIGLAIGIAAALGLTQYLRSLLYGIDSTDPVTFGVVAFALLTLGVVASYNPARRATSLNPRSALRRE